MSRKCKKVRGVLNKNFLVFFSAISGCVSISAFASLVGVPVSITSSAVGLNIFALISGIKKYKSILKKKEKKHDNIVLPKLS